MTGSRIVAAVAFAWVVGSGAAPSWAAADDEDPGPATPPAPEPDDGKSPWIAAALTGGTALVGYGTAVALAVGTDFEPEGLFVGAAAVGLLGPAAGHIYVGENRKHAVAFALGRVGFVAMGLLGFAELLADDDGQTSGRGNKLLGHTLIGMAGTGVVGLTVWETVDSYRCAEATHRPANALALTPFLLPTPAGGVASGGMLLSGRF